MSEDCYQWLINSTTEQKEDVVIKAKKVEIELGNIKIHIYELPNGE